MVVAGENEVFGCFEANALVGAWKVPLGPDGYQTYEGTWHTSDQN